MRRGEIRIASSLMDANKLRHAVTVKVTDGMLVSPSQ